MCQVVNTLSLESNLTLRYQKSTHLLLQNKDMQRYPLLRLYWHDPVSFCHLSPPSEPNSETLPEFNGSGSDPTYSCPTKGFGSAVYRGTVELGR